MRPHHRARLAVAAAAVLTIGGSVVARACGCTLPSFVTPPTPGGCDTYDATGCAVSTTGTTLTFANPTHMDLAGTFLVNCTGNLLTYASGSSQVGRHQDAVVSGSGWPVHINITQSGGALIPIAGGTGTSQIKLTTGCVGQGPLGETTMSAASVGATTITVAANPGGVMVQGSALIVGNGATAEVNKVNAIAGTTITLETPLTVAQSAGARVRVTAVDLVVNMVESPTLGGGTEDAVKIDGGAGCPNGQQIDDPTHTGAAACPGINIAGNVNCGPHASGAHADGIQFLGGTNIGLFNTRVGNWANKAWTCVGDGGALYINAAAPNGNVTSGSCVSPTFVSCKNYGLPVNLLVNGMVAIGCNKGLHTQVVSQSTAVSPSFSSGAVRNGYYRAGQTTALGGGAGCGASTGAFSSGTNYNQGIVNMKSDWPNGSVGTSPTVVTDTFGDTYTAGSFNSTYDGQ